MLQSIVDDHEVLRSFHTFTLDTLDMDKLNASDYPLLYGQCTDAVIMDGMTEFTYEEQQEHITQIYSETFLLLQDVAAQFAFNVNVSSLVDGNNWSFQLPLQCQPFTARFDNSLTGWSTTFSIRLPNALNLCEAPYG
jgi:hypothetical protein